MEDENENKDKVISEYDIAFKNYVEMRTKKKTPTTENAISLIKLELERLAPRNENKQIQILNQSIMRGWTGVFPLKETEEPKTNSHLKEK